MQPPQTSAAAAEGAAAAESRHMNDTTMPPPKTSSRPGTAVAAKQPAPQQQPRSKKGLRKGFGLSDWNRLTQVSKDLAQRRGQALRRIRWDEIRRHSSVHDGWIVLKGKVYFISPYLAYHPGGERILKPALGKDATTLFDKYHRWVNEEPLIGKLLVGYLDNTRIVDDDEDDEEEKQRTSYLPTAAAATNANMPPPPRRRKTDMAVKPPAATTGDAAAETTKEKTAETKETETTTKPKPAEQESVDAEPARRRRTDEV